jgi:ABC-type transporter Mla subunit MlaD
LQHVQVEQLLEVLEERENEIEELKESLQELAEGNPDTPTKVSQQLAGSAAKADRVKCASDTSSAFRE